MRYLLDTDFCIHVISERPPAVLERFIAPEADGIGLSVISASELYRGVRKSGSRRKSRWRQTTCANSSVCRG